LITLDEFSLQEIRTIENVEEVSPLSLINAQMTFGELSANTQIFAVNASYFQLGGVKPRIGDVFHEGEHNKILVSEAVTTLFNIEDINEILGKQVTFSLLLPKGEEEIEVVVRKETYEVVGIAEDSDSSFVYLPLASLSDLNITNYSQAKIKVFSEQDLETVRSEIVEMGFLVSAVSEQ